MPAVKSGSKDVDRVRNTASKKSSTNSSAQPEQTDANEHAVGSTDEEEKIHHVSEKRSSTVGAERMGNLRDKFEKGELADKKKQKKKAAPRMKYAGVESVKTKFIEEASKTVNGNADAPRGPKEITPPRDGANCGVLESQPQARAPGVISSDDMFEPVDLKVIGGTTRNLRAKFKQMEETGGQLDAEPRERTNSLVDEVNTVAPDASRSARARWKDIESGKNNSEQPIERPKIDIKGDGYGGVYENEPQHIDGVVRSGDPTEKDLLTSVSARERKEEFLRKAAEEAQIKREGVKPLDINATESGIYENEPARRDDVIRYDDEQAEDYATSSAKWASEAKMRFMEEASKAQQAIQRTQPIAVAETDAVDGAELEHGASARYATQAKQAFLERQRQAEEAAKNKARPDIINIWSEPCEHSGVFENKPAARTADVVAGSESEEEEEEEEQNET